MAQSRGLPVNIKFTMLTCVHNSQDNQEAYLHRLEELFWWSHKPHPEGGEEEQPQWLWDQCVSFCLSSKGRWQSTLLTKLLDVLSKAEAVRKCFCACGHPVWLLALTETLNQPLPPLLCNGFSLFPSVSCYSACYSFKKYCSTTHQIWLL